MVASPPLANVLKDVNASLVSNDAFAAGMPPGAPTKTGNVPLASLRIGEALAARSRSCPGGDRVGRALVSPPEHPRRRPD
ncbi:hypothetical protein [Frankia tisae]|uniref:hypothetical protein n=1 Tax=Frankia tisae TaxID=2950104 RepID=UPI0021C05B9C|nr:hypothetical protein [Frankia tisae]